MNKNLITKQNTNLVLNKSKSTLSITSKILSGKTSLVTKDVDGWIKEIFNWADNENISSNIIPRDTDKLLKLEKINLCGYRLDHIPEELMQLENLNFLDLGNNNLINIPSSIGELKNLNFFSIATNNLIKVPKSITKLKKLNNFWFAGNNLVLDEEQAIWVENLKKNGCYVYY